MDARPAGAAVTTVLATIIAAPNPSGHRHAMLRCHGTRHLLPTTNPAVGHTGFAGDWQTVPRSGEKPLLGMAAGQLHQQKVTCKVARKDGSPVEELLTLILNMSRDADHVVTLAHYGYLEAGPWRMTDVAITTERRKFGTNQVTRATVTLTLQEAVPEPRPTAHRPPKKHHHKKPAPGGAKTRIYVVKRGDTLSRIAQKMYGNANLWPRIARANHLRDPNRITPGQRLKIP